MLPAPSRPALGGSFSGIWLNIPFLLEKISALQFLCIAMGYTIPGTHLGRFLSHASYIQVEGGDETYDR